MKKNKTRPRGRPRNFDSDEVLDRAVDTFWAKGYSSTSLDDLTESMKINRPSLYASFGNKHDLFMKSIDRYAKTVAHLPIDAFLQQRELKSAVEEFFTTTIECVTSKQRPRGCLIMNVAGERAAIDEEVRARMDDAYNEKVSLIAERIEAVREPGQPPGSPDANILARMIVSIMHSLAARARVGASRKELSELAKSFSDLLIPK